MNALLDKNPHRGGSFDAFLKEEGIFDEVQAQALERVLTEQAAEATDSAHSTDVPKGLLIRSRPNLALQ
jgi:hypothetical protein